MLTSIVCCIVALGHNKVVHILGWASLGSTCHVGSNAPYLLNCKFTENAFMAEKETHICSAMTVSLCRTLSNKVEMIPLLSGKSGKPISNSL